MKWKGICINIIFLSYCSEWEKSPFLSMMDFKKTFNIVHRDSLQKNTALHPHLWTHSVQYAKFMLLEFIMVHLDQNESQRRVYIIAFSFSNSSKLHNEKEFGCNKWRHSPFKKSNSKQIKSRFIHKEEMTIFWTI